MSTNQTIIDEVNHATYSNDTEQTLLSRTVTENSSGAMGVRVTARRVSDGATKVWFFEHGIKRASGDATIFGLQLLSTKGTVADLIALAAVTADIDVAGSDTRVRVKGLASSEIDWIARQYGEEVNHV